MCLKLFLNGIWIHLKKILVLKRRFKVFVCIDDLWVEDIFVLNVKSVAEQATSVNQFSGSLATERGHVAMQHPGMEAVYKTEIPKYIVHKYVLNIKQSVQSSSLQ